jgi:multicomponent Na+:H+ antiporter subunit G
MDAAIDLLSWICLIGGGAFALIGAIGILRLPDVFTRMHAAGIVDTLGAGLILLGLILQAGFSAPSIKLALIGVFLFFTSPVTTHALARAALHGGTQPLLPEGGKAPAADKEPPPSTT